MSSEMKLNRKKFKRLNLTGFYNPTAVKLYRSVQPPVKQFHLLVYFRQLISLQLFSDQTDLLLQPPSRMCVTCQRVSPCEETAGQCVEASPESEVDVLMRFLTRDGRETGRTQRSQDEEEEPYT